MAKKALLWGMFCIVLIFEMAVTGCESLAEVILSGISNALGSSPGNDIPAQEGLIVIPVLPDCPGKEDKAVPLEQGP
jgi:hypothetical protein